MCYSVFIRNRLLTTVKVGYDEQLWTGLFIRYNHVNFCAKMIDLTLNAVRYNQVFVNKRVRYSRVSLYIFCTSFFIQNKS
jgi:hypothetical protein